MHEFINKILRQGSTEYWYCTSQLQTVHTLYKNRAKSTGGNRARFSWSKKYIPLTSFLLNKITYSEPKWLRTTDNFWLFSLNETYLTLFEVTCKRNPELFPAGLKCILFSGDQSITWSVIRWALQTSPLWTIFEAVYHQQMSITMEWKVRSFIIRINNHGPNLVPCGTPDGTGPHLEK